jgi:hypothetical protein
MPDDGRLTPVTIGGYGSSIETKIAPIESPDVGDHNETAISVVETTKPTLLPILSQKQPFNPAFASPHNHVTVLLGKAQEAAFWRML